MEELRKRIQALLNEIEYTHLKTEWVEKIVEAGIEREDAYKWVAEIGHVVDNYERSLRRLTELFEQDSAEDIAVSLHTWIHVTMEMTTWAIDRAMKEMDGRYEKYLPEDDD